VSADGLKRFELGDVIGLEPIPGETCDAVNATRVTMPDGSTRCRCVVCPRCGHHAGNSHQGHHWGFCQVTRSLRTPHFCCGNEFGCELEPAKDGDDG
jgi:hypothetical protein